MLIKLTVEEDLIYGKLIGDYLNFGYTDLMAEKLCIRDLKKIFPRLNKLIKKGLKISI